MITIHEFLKKYKLTDYPVSSDYVKIITEIVNGKIAENIDNDNDNIRLYIGLYYKYEKKDYELAETHFLKAAECGNVRAMHNLGFLYAELNKFDLAKKII